MSKDDNNPLRKLVNAEREASEIIAREERYRSKRLQEAESVVQEIYEKRRSEEETKFQQEVKSNDGEGDEKLKVLAQEVAAEKAEQGRLYDAARETAIGTLLHVVTSCEIKVDESQRQAFLAIKREKEQGSAPAH